MRTEFDVGRVSWSQLHARQLGLCAISGRPLNESAVAHHVVPAPLGEISPEAQAFVGDIERNCVLVNDRGEEDDSRAEGSHLQEAHGGRFSGGVVAEFSEFKWSHGGDIEAHQAWANENSAIATELVWVPLRQAQGRSQAQEQSHDWGMDL